MIGWVGERLEPGYRASSVNFCGWLGLLTCECLVSQLFGLLLWALLSVQLFGAMEPGPIKESNETFSESLLAQLLRDVHAAARMIIHVMSGLGACFKQTYTWLSRIGWRSLPCRRLPWMIRSSSSGRRMRRVRSASPLLWGWSWIVCLAEVCA